MEQNLYAPPEALILDVPADAAAAREYYVVSATKFLVLFAATLGAYQLYWFYKHWASWREQRRADIWPVMRAFFAIFFAYSLAEEIEHSLRRSGSTRSFAAGPLAAAFVVLQLFSQVGERFLPDSLGIGLAAALSFGVLAAIGAILLQYQRAANAACGDDAGAANSTYTWANWIWIALGVVLWVYTIAIYAALAGVGPLALE